MADTCNIDVNEIECPACGHVESWQDVQTDGCLEAGYEDTCSGCGAALKISAVDWDPTVWVTTKEKPHE